MWLEKPAVGHAGEQKKQALVRGCDAAAPVSKPAATGDHVHVKEQVHSENCNVSHRLLIKVHLAREQCEADVLECALGSLPQVSGCPQSQQQARFVF